MRECQYSNPELPDYKCKKECFGGHEFCIFHLPESDLYGGLKDGLYPDKLFYDELNKLHKNKNGDWIGIKFPLALRLNNIEIDYDIDLSFSEFEKIEI